VQQIVHRHGVLAAVLRVLVVLGRAPTGKRVCAGIDAPPGDAGSCPSGGVGCEPLADLNIDGVVGSQDLALILNNWDSTCSCAALDDASEVPEMLAFGARASLDFSIQYVGLVDVPTYQQWTAQVPPELRALFDQVIWSVAKEGGIDP
jgi:hypothetical protein